MKITTNRLTGVPTPGPVDAVDDCRRESMSYPRHATSVVAARTHVQNIAEERGLGSLVDDLTLVVSELITNAIVHAKGGREVWLNFELNQTTLRIEIRDSGQTFDFLFVDQPDLENESGRGIAIITELADKYGMDEHAAGKTVWAEFSLRVNGRES